MSACSRREAMTYLAGLSAAATWEHAMAEEKTARPAPEVLSFERRLPVLPRYEAVVCGGGPAGVAAALAARRAGLKTLLLDAQGQLGGMGTSGLVSHWLGGRSADCRRWVVGGLFRAMAEEAAREGFALLPMPTTTKYQPHGWYQGLAAGVPFDPFALAAYLDRRIAAARIDLLLLTQAVDARVEGDRLTHVVILNKSGLAAVPADVVVDATGDADLAARSGCGVVKGRAEDGLTAPASLIFHVENVDQDALSAYIHEKDAPRFRAEIEKLRQAGEWTFPYDILISVQLHEKGTLMINTTRLVGVDGTDGASLSQGLARGREEIVKLMVLMRKHFPGFSRARLKAVAPFLGVRETRRIRGLYELKLEDVLRGRAFDDTIGFSAYGWDLPDPQRPSDNPAHGKKGELTPIPYRIMVPAGPVANLICPGRAVSVERPVLGPLRVMAPCMAMGEAAGEAAALAVRGRKAFRDLDVQALRAALKKNGGVVDPV